MARARATARLRARSIRRSATSAIGRRPRFEQVCGVADWSSAGHSRRNCAKPSDSSSATSRRWADWRSPSIRSLDLRQARRELVRQQGFVGGEREQEDVQVARRPGGASQPREGPPERLRRLARQDPLDLSESGACPPNGDPEVVQALRVEPQTDALLVLQHHVEEGPEDRNRRRSGGLIGLHHRHRPGRAAEPDRLRVFSRGPHERKTLLPRWVSGNAQEEPVAAQFEGWVVARAELSGFDRGRKSV